MSLESGTGPTGWTCPMCRSFVPNGCTHHCPSTTVIPVVDPRFSNPPKPDVFERIAVALERIATAMEAERA